MQIDKMQLLKIMREKSVSYGHFTLSSGKESTYYIDSKLTTFDPKGISLAGKLVFEKIKNSSDEITAVGGLTMGADPIAISTVIAAFNENYNLKAFSVRKKAKTHGKRKLIEGNLDTKDKVIILDDVITTGDSTIKAIEAVREYGCNIIMVVALVDRREGGTEKIRELGYDIQAIFTIDELLDSTNLEKVNTNDDNGESNIIGGKGVFRRELV